jgi:hypothetical protein
VKLIQLGLGRMQPRFATEDQGPFAEDGGQHWAQNKEHANRLCAAGKCDRIRDLAEPGPGGGRSGRVRSRDGAENTKVENDRVVPRYHSSRYSSENFQGQRDTEPSLSDLHQLRVGRDGKLYDPPSQFSATRSPGKRHLPKGICQLFGTGIDLHSLVRYDDRPEMLPLLRPCRGRDSKATPGFLRLGRALEYCHFDFERERFHFWWLHSTRLEIPKWLRV